MKDAPRHLFPVTVAAIVGGICLAVAALAGTISTTVALSDADDISVTKTADTTTTGTATDRRTISVATNETAHAIGAEVTGGNGPGWTMLTNRATTNYVQVGTATSVYWGRFDAGESMLVKLDAAVTSLYFKADTAACDVTIDIRER